MSKICRTMEKLWKICRHGVERFHVSCLEADKKHGSVGLFAIKAEFAWKDDEKDIESMKQAIE